MAWDESSAVTERQQEPELDQEPDQEEQEQLQVDTLDQITTALDLRRIQAQAMLDKVRSTLEEARQTLDQITSVLDLHQIREQATPGKVHNTLVETQVEDRAASASTRLATAVRRRSTKAILSTAIAELARRLPRPTISSGRDHNRNHDPSATPLLTGRKLARRRGSEKKNARRRKRTRRSKLMKPKGRRRKTVRRELKQKRLDGSRCARGRGRPGNGRLVRKLQESEWRKKRQN
jgi:hypothetical protein